VGKPQPGEGGVGARLRVVVEGADLLAGDRPAHSDSGHGRIGDVNLPPPDPSRPVRIGNASGFYGDRLSAMREMLEGGPLDVLTGDYLAELTMLILWRSRAKDPGRGFATTFLRQLEDTLGLAVERGVRIVTNAGGLNPAGCADAVRALAERLGLDVAVAHVEGDDVLGRPGVPPDAVTANAYLGGWPIAAALAGGAHVVVTGRCTDAALVSGPAAWWHGWSRSSWHQLAGAVVAGHVLECGAQATGGNYAFWAEVPDLTHPGFPLAEVAADGSAVVTKHPGTGGLVSVGTVTAQLLYEIGPPWYGGPDVVADFASVALEQVGPDRVRLAGTRGRAPEPSLKVATNRLGGWRNGTTFVLTGLDIDGKAELVRRSMAPALEGVEATWTLARTDVPDADTEQRASALLTVDVRSGDRDAVGRRFSSAGIELALASYPGFQVTAPPSDATPYGIYGPAWISRDSVEPVVVHADGRREEVPHTEPGVGGAVAVSSEQWPDEGGATQRAPLGVVAGARSGDKGGDANIGVWVRDAAALAWLTRLLTPARVRELLPEAAGLPVQVWELPNLLAVNIVISGLLGEGVASSTRFDPQAKALGEWLRSRLVDVPVSLLPEPPVAG